MCAQKPTIGAGHRSPGEVRGKHLVVVGDLAEGNVADKVDGAAEARASKRRGREVEHRRIVAGTIIVAAVGDDEVQGVGPSDSNLGVRVAWV